MAADRDFTEQAQHDRLLRALTAESSLTCEEAEPLIAEYAHAEATGQDVDADPAFAEARAHLHSCASCLALYAGLAEDLSTLMQGRIEPLPAQPAPAFFPPDIVREWTHATLRVWTGVRRAFELVLSPPPLGPKIPVLSDSRSLFGQQLDDVAGKPHVSASAATAGEHVIFRVAVGDLQAPASWRVRLVAGERRMEQMTDPQGIAEFPPIPRADWDSITITLQEA